MLLESVMILELFKVKAFSGVTGATVSIFCAKCRYLHLFFKSFAIRKADLIHAWGSNMVPSLLEHGAVKEKILETDEVWWLDLTARQYRWVS